MFGVISMVILWSAVVVSEVSSNVCQGSALKYKVLEKAVRKLSETYKNIQTLETDTPTMDAENPPYIFCTFTVHARWPNFQEVCTVDCMFFKGDKKPTDVTVTKCETKANAMSYRKRTNDHPTGHQSPGYPTERQRRQSTGQRAAPQQTPGAHYGTRPRYQSDPTPPPRHSPAVPFPTTRPPLTPPRPLPAVQNRRSSPRPPTPPLPPKPFTTYTTALEQLEARYPPRSPAKQSQPSRRSPSSPRPSQRSPPSPRPTLPPRPPLSSKEFPLLAAPSRRPTLPPKPNPSTTTTHAHGQWNTGSPTTTQGRQQQQQRPQRPKLEEVKTGWNIPGVKKRGGRGELGEGRANQKTHAPRVSPAQMSSWQPYYGY